MDYYYKEFNKLQEEFHDVMHDYPLFKETLKGDIAIESRLCSFRVKEDRKEDFVRLFDEYFGNDFVLKTKEEVINDNLFGLGTEHERFRESLGDYLALAISDKYFRYCKDSKEFISVHAGLTEDELNIPDDIIEVNLFEGNEGFDTFGYESFKICVGKTISLNEIRRNKIKNVIFSKRATSYIDSPDDKLCYFKNENNMYMVFAKIDKGDIVVESPEELKDALIYISRRFNTIKSEISRIREYGKEEIIESKEDEKNREKRMKMYIKQRKNNNGGNYV